MSPRDIAAETASALDANRGRSLLTVLGIVIGIAAVIAMTSLIGGIRNSLVGELGLDASRRIEIYAYGNSGGLNQNKLDSLQSALPSYEFITGAYTSGATTTGKSGKSINATVYGCEENFLTASGLKVKRGRCWTDEEAERGALVCLLTSDAMRQVFGDAEAEPSGQTVKLDSGVYTVIGVIESSIYNNMGEGYINAWIPTKTAESRMGRSGSSYDAVVGFAKESADIDTLVESTKTQVAKLLNVSVDDEDNGIYISSMKAVIDSMNQYMNSFSLMIGAVASISLVVGGIGIMNMMLTNVTERIREIGLRRALGATRGDITTQFLVESIAISVAGGVIGVFVGFVGSWALTALASATGMVASLGASGDITPAISPSAVAMATGICILIGLVFGYYPARRAARLDPVEALRYQ